MFRFSWFNSTSSRLCGKTISSLIYIGYSNRTVISLKQSWRLHPHLCIRKCNRMNRIIQSFKQEAILVQLNGDTLECLGRKAFCRPTTESSPACEQRCIIMVEILHINVFSGWTICTFLYFIRRSKPKQQSSSRNYRITITRNSQANVQTSEKSVFR